MRTVLMVAVLLLASMGAMASETSDLQTMVEQQQALRDDLANGTAEVTPRQAGIIKKAQAEFFAIVEGKTTLDQLAIDDQIRIENALERINAQVVNTNAARNNQQVCWREHKTGSKTTTTRCGTQQEIDEAREGARGYLEKPKVCTPPGCGT